ncbi:calcium-activated chloride channel-domain-containing protein [Glomus cerebriforme]|uniref:Calcium-activated chloride channel-domain-containing protein n=1 Tax=Glomus cerebriforme TaxID=658196 RepID=A0A397SVI0_9GLOM|nr:calcium-activated chloride channel-domain-containing protein [Glomus cerebriforme]
MSENSDTNSQITSKNLAQEAGKLLFHQIRQKGSKDIFADYIILLRTTPLKNLAAADKEEHKTKLEETCRKVLTRLQEAGLQAEVRRGSDKLVFIFVLCDLHRLKREVDTSRINDWFAGVRVKDIQNDNDVENDEPLSDSERLRLIYEIITKPVREKGAGINPGLGDFELVESILLLQDGEYNEDWIKTWSTKWIIEKEELFRLRNHFGEKIAYYFAFLQYYCVWLVAPSTVGLFTWLFLSGYSTFFGVFIVLWCIVFVEFWRRKEYELSVEWGVRNYSRVERYRPTFQEECYIPDGVTGDKKPYFSPWKRWLRRAVAAPIIIMFSLTLAVSLLFYILLDVIMSDYYTGPFREQLIYLPTIAYCALVPTLNMFYTKIARRLNEYENYETESYYEFNLSQKIFISNFLLGYLSIFFIGWIYIPFNNEIGQFFGRFFEIFGLSLTIKRVGPERLMNELKYFVLTAQIMNLFMEIGLPYLLRAGEVGVKKIQRTTTKDDARNEDESAFLKRVRKEAKLPVYDIYTDYSEIIIQFGYVSLFSVIWPLTPIAALINNWVELRSDAIKMCVHTRRPIPCRADSIGPWLENLTLLTWLSAITNPSLLYLYHPTSNAFSSASLIVIMALIFCTEHIFSFIHYIVQQMMSAIPNSADEYIKKQEYEAKKRLLEKRESSIDALKRKISSQKNEESWFWDDHSLDLEESLRSAIHDYKIE